MEFKSGSVIMDMLVALIILCFIIGVIEVINNVAKWTASLLIFLYSKIKLKGETNNKSIRWWWRRGL